MGTEPEWLATLKGAGYDGYSTSSFSYQSVGSSLVLNIGSNLAYVIGNNIIISVDSLDPPAPMLAEISYYDAPTGDALVFITSSPASGVGPYSQWKIGLIGATGPAGSQGPQGATGPQGIQGETGVTGATGPKGDTGDQGPAGNDGAPGADGLDGATGPAGADGAQGPSGVVSVTAPITNTGTSTSAVIGIEGSALVPTGAMMMWYTNTAPAGWIFCRGQSTSGYTALAAVIGATVPDLQTRVPVGKNTSGTFGTLGAVGGAEQVALTQANIPSHTHSGNTGTVSADHTHSGGTGGVSANHTHNIGNRPVVSSATNGPFFESWPGGSGTARTHTSGGHSADHSHSFTTGGISANHIHGFTTDGGAGLSGSSLGSAHNNLQPYIVINYIIKL
jgi:microcystin-dependent protein